jgi:hypothetical protein
MVGVRGLEPPTPASQTRCASQLRYTPEIEGQPTVFLQRSIGKSRVCLQQTKPSYYLSLK